MAPPQDEAAGTTIGNKRKHPRFEVTAYADLGAADRETPYCRVQNISLGGICVHTPLLEAVGTHVSLVIHFPELDATFSARGEVLWTEDEQLMDMGIRFVGLDPEQTSVLQRYLGLLAQR